MTPAMGDSGFGIRRRLFLALPLQSAPARLLESRIPNPESLLP